MDCEGTVNPGILLSGGMDSLALAYWKRPEVAFTVDYGQLCAAAEVRTAAQIAVLLNMHHEVIRVDCRALGAGDLAGLAPSIIAPVPEWWPFRNQLLVTLAAMRAVAIGVDCLLAGSVASDFSHRDGRPEFYAQLDTLLAVQEGSVHVDAPALALSTADLVRIANVPRHILAWAHSCHVADYACGTCRGCNKHREVFEELGYAAY